jgi:hypothetical protein
MAKFGFNPDSLRRGFALVKQVKPATGDFVLKFISGIFVIYSADKRRRCRVEIPPIDIIEDFDSDDYYLPMDRTSLFEIDLEKVSISITDKGMVIKSEGSGQSRQATVKKRLDNSRRATIPPRIVDISDNDISTMPKKVFDELLRQVSCSALVKETKTEEDMKVNQVHFYPNHSMAVSNARFYASFVHSHGLSLDLSIVSADIPIIRNFCSRVSGDKISVGQTNRELVILDPITRSSIGFSRVSCTRPPLQILSDDGFSVEVSVDASHLSKSLSWCAMALEGTSRLSIETKSNGDANFLVLSSGGNELSRMPVNTMNGYGIKADFPASILMNLCSSVDSDNIILRYKHKSQPTILEIRGALTESHPVIARHFVQSMKERT